MTGWVAAIAAALLILPSQESWAIDGRVLPKGRFRFSVLYARAEGVSHEFDANGSRTALTAPYNFSLSSENIKSLIEDGSVESDFLREYNSLIGALNDTEMRYNAAEKNGTFHGLTNDPAMPLLGDALARGNLNVTGGATRQQYNFMLQYGLTDRFGLGLQVPLINDHVNVAAQITGENSIEDIYQAVKNRGGSFGEGYQQLIDGLDKFRKIDTEALQQLLTDIGYNRFDSTQAVGVGDIVVGGRYKYWDAKHASGQWIGSMQGGVTVPVGKIYHPSYITALDRGQGAWDIGLAHILNYSPVSPITLSHSFNYTYIFPTKWLDRVPSSPDDMIPDPASEHEMDLKLGNKLWTTFGTKISINSVLSFDSHYEFYWRQAHVYSGPRPGLRYDVLGMDTELYLETLQFGASLSSIQGFLDEKFPLPGDLSFNYFIPIRGKNAIIAPFVTAELALYF